MLKYYIIIWFASLQCISTLMVFEVFVQMQQEVPDHQKVESYEDTENPTAVRNKRSEGEGPFFLLYVDSTVSIDEGHRWWRGFNSGGIANKLQKYLIILF